MAHARLLGWRTGMVSSGAGERAKAQELIATGSAVVTVNGLVTWPHGKGHVNTPMLRAGNENGPARVCASLPRPPRLSWPEDTSGTDSYSCRAPAPRYCFDVSDPEASQQRRPNCRPASTATAPQVRRHLRLSLNGSEESMFGKGRSPELEQMLDSLGRSYMRGSVHGTPEARAGLVTELSVYAQRLRQEGHGKAIEKARDYRPGFFMGLPQDAQTDFQQHVSSALG